MGFKKDKILTHSDLSKVHKFKIDDKLYVFDICSAHCFKIDRISWDILEDLAVYDIGELKNRLKGKYSSLEIQRAINELERKKEKKLLFTSRKPPQFRRYKIKKFCQTKNLKQITIYPCLDCNLTCSYCFHPYNQMKIHMDVLTADKTVDFILRCSAKECEIDFHGGEPLLNFEIVKFITAELTKRARKYRKKFNFSMSTNGVVCNKEIIQFLRKYDFSVMVSVDGPEDIHNSMRRYVNRGGSYRQVLDNLKNYFQPYFDMKKVGIVAVLSPIYFDRFEEIYNYFINLQQRIRFKKLIIANIAYRRELFSQVYLNKYKQILKQSAQLFLNRCISEKRFIGGLPHFSNYIKQIYNFKSSRQFLPCPGGINQLVILPQGGLIHCRQVESLPNCNDFIFGNISNIEDIKEKERLLLYNRTLVSPQECNACWARYFCIPSCPAFNYYATKNFLLPDNIRCEITKTRIEYSIWILEEMIQCHIDLSELK